MDARPVDAAGPLYISCWPTYFPSFVNRLITNF